jgi:hypothetical protein
MTIIVGSIALFFPDRRNAGERGGGESCRRERAGIGRISAKKYRNLETAKVIFLLFFIIFSARADFSSVRVFSPSPPIFSLPPIVFSDSRESQKIVAQKIVV